MAFTPLRRMKEEDKEILNQKATAFAKRHDLTLNDELAPELELDFAIYYLEQDQDVRSYGKRLRRQFLKIMARAWNVPYGPDLTWGYGDSAYIGYSVP